MSIASTFLDTSRKQLIRTIATALCINNIASIIVFGVLWAFTPTALFGQLVGLNAFSLICAGVTLWFITSKPLWLAVLPTAVNILVVVNIGAVLFPELNTVAAPFLVVVVMLACLSNNRRMTLAFGIVTIISAVFILLSVPASTENAGIFSIGAALVPARFLYVNILIIIVWLVADRLIASQAAAIAIADQRASEAEAARTLAESARAEVEQRSAEQQRLLDLVQTLELPIIPMGQGVLVVPLVGALDTRRMDGIRKNLLDTVSTQRAHTVVLDVTGVSVLDTAVARSLLQTAQAVKLLGAETMVSGIRASVAQTLVSLGVDLAGLRPTNDLGQALEVVKQRAEA
jgi:anti-anti-sigma factor